MKWLLCLCVHNFMHLHCLLDIYVQHCTYLDCFGYVAYIICNTQKRTNNNRYLQLLNIYRIAMLKCLLLYENIAIILCTPRLVCKANIPRHKHHLRARANKLQILYLCYYCYSRRYCICKTV